MMHLAYGIFIDSRRYFPPFFLSAVSMAIITTAMPQNGMILIMLKDSHPLWMTLTIELTAITAMEMAKRIRHTVMTLRCLDDIVVSSYR